MKKLCVTSLILVAALIAGPALAQDLIVYPGKGQSNEQMEQDKYACYEWAREQTGFDPMKTPTATEAPPSQEAPEGGVVKGALGGAALGAIGGAIAGDAGTGAAIGAGVGSLFGGMKRRNQVAREQEEQDQWAQQQAAQYHQKRNTYNRAYSACLEAKGYTVK
jgi:outer membrane lipoprotein SlyB